jgi:hypothetical protein
MTNRVQQQIKTLNVIKIWLKSHILTFCYFRKDFSADWLQPFRLLFFGQIGGKYVSKASQNFGPTEVDPWGIMGQNAPGSDACRQWRLDSKTQASVEADGDIFEI